MADHRIVEAWQLYDLDNDALKGQRVLVEEVVAAAASEGTEEVSKAKELLALIVEEMKERGVAYTLGARLQTLVTTAPLSTPINDDAMDAAMDKAAGSLSQRKLHDFFAVRPPWFEVSDSLEITSASVDEVAPQKRRGLWDRDTSSDDGDDVKPRKTRMRRKGSSAAPMAVMNKLGFFVVPTKRRAKKAVGVPPPAAVKKPPVPLAGPRKAPVLKPLSTAPIKSSNHKAPTGKPKLQAATKPSKSSVGLPPVQPQRSSTAIPFEGGRTLLALPQRPASAELTPSPAPQKATTNDTPSDDAQIWWSDDVGISEIADTSAACASQQVAPTGEMRRDACGTSMEADEQEPSTAEVVRPCTLDAMPPDCPHSPGDSVAPASARRASPRQDIPPASPTLVVIKETVLSGAVNVCDPSPSKTFTSATPESLADAAAEPSGIQQHIPPSINAVAAAAAAGPLSHAVPKPVTKPSQSVPKAPAAAVPPSHPMPQTPVTPLYLSLESMMIDPTYFFSFDTQPYDVRQQAFQMMRSALRCWLQLPQEGAQFPKVQKASHAARLRLPPAIPDKQHAIQPCDGDDDNDDTELVVAASLKADALRWYYCQTSHDEVYDLVTAVLEEMEDENALPWQETPPARHFSQGSVPTSADGSVPNCWNLWWTWGKPRVQQKAVWLRGAQYVNHIPRSWHLTKKDSLKSNVQRYCRTALTVQRASANLQGRKEREMFEIVPPSFVLPKEYVAFATFFADHRGTWIMKTIGMSRGRGISLVSDIADVVYDAPVVVQRYIDRPLTVDNGFKFDLRLYVVVTSFQPRLEAFISTLGFARIAAYRYQATDLSNLYAHLTNTSISGAAKKEKGDGSSNRGPPRADTKWTLDRLAADINRRGRVGWPQLWANIKLVVLKALVCVEDNIPAAPCTFELFGFDILVDEDFAPWVLEVNASPSLEVDSAEDEAVKPQLIEDIVHLLDIGPIDRHALLAALERRIGARDGGPSSKKQNKCTWEDEFRAIFRGWEPRPLGVDPTRMGSFERIAPTQQYAQLNKAKRAV